jgi:hypothetical protein
LATPLQSYRFALFAQDTGVGIPSKICSLFSRVSALRKNRPAPSLPAVAALPWLYKASCGGGLSRGSSRCTPVGAPLFSNGKRSLSLFPSHRCGTLSRATREGYTHPLIQMGFQGDLRSVPQCLCGQPSSPFVRVHRDAADGYTLHFSPDSRFKGGVEGACAQW